MKVKVNTNSHDCYGANEIVCPFCGGIQSDSWEYGDGETIGVIECGHCGRSFEAERVITIEYTSRPIDTSVYDEWEIGDVFDDGIKDMKEEEWSNKFGETPCAVVEE
jgi:transcription elongation factor Elf1